MTWLWSPPPMLPFVLLNTLHDKQTSTLPVCHARVRCGSGVQLPTMIPSHGAKNIRHHVQYIPGVSEGTLKIFLWELLQTPYSSTQCQERYRRFQRPSSPLTILAALKCEWEWWSCCCCCSSSFTSQRNMQINLGYIYPETSDAVPSVNKGDHHTQPSLNTSTSHTQTSLKAEAISQSFALTHIWKLSTTWLYEINWNLNIYIPRF